MEYETYYILVDGNKKRTFKNRKGVEGDACARAYRAYKKALENKPVYELYKYVYLYMGSVGCSEKLIEATTVSSDY